MYTKIIQLFYTHSFSKWPVTVITGHNEKENKMKKIKIYWFIIKQILKGKNLEQVTQQINQDTLNRLNWCKGKLAKTLKEVQK